MAALVATGTVACARCGKLIATGQSWDLDHADDGSGEYLGPAHSGCNRSFGAVSGNRARAAAYRAAKGLPDPPERPSHAQQRQDEPEIIGSLHLIPGWCGEE